MPKATVPVTSVPMKLPATTLPSVPWPLIQTPRRQLPLSHVPLGRSFTPSPLVPIRLSLAPPSISTPYSLGSACVPVGSVPRKLA